MQKKHITILVSPEGEEFYAAYGPMTKDRDKATEFFTNDQTLRPPHHLGLRGDAFWESEKRSEEMTRKKYKNWTYKHVPLD